MRTQKNTDKSIQKFRSIVQLLFIFLCVWIGIEFFFFVRYFEMNGTITFNNRPPGVEGFLPISSLMNFLYFLRTGTIHQVHPAGFFIFTAIITISLFFGKSFCSWLCPIGTLSEWIGKFSLKIIPVKIGLSKYIDYPLRGLKYFMLIFLLFFILPMSAEALNTFLTGGYNIIADIKMYYFFARISSISLIVICIIVLLTFFIRDFWCRYLCPYGALLGFIGLLSPFKIKRNSASCIQCGKCTKVCPARIKVDKLNYILSDECTSCIQCIDICPVKDSLDYKFINSNKTIHKKWIGLIIISLFILITGIGMITKNWKNNISKDIYMKNYKIRDSFTHH